MAMDPKIRARLRALARAGEFGQADDPLAVAPPAGEVDRSAPSPVETGPLALGEESKAGA